MSKMAKETKKERAIAVHHPVVNFMGGISYEINPLDTLKMITASSIFGEPQYYRDGEFQPASALKDGLFEIDPLFRPYSIFTIDLFAPPAKTSEVMEQAIDAALDYDFEQTLRWAATLRMDFYMRLNPQVIMVRAAMHPKRAEFNEAHPGLFSELNAKVMFRADEPASQLAYYLYRNKSKNNIPNVLKRNWAAKLESLSPYEVHKYKNAEIGMIDVVRICHANSEPISELMKTGTVQVEDDDNTWEALRSQGKSWREIYGSVRMGHMAVLRNLRGMFTEIDDLEFCQRVMEDLKRGVLHGKQFPFRYYSAMTAVKKALDQIHHAPLILDTLEECIDIACDNMPKLKGRTMCLSDNSGSAWGSLTSEYGSVTVAEIDNLSSVITAKNSEEGFVGKFGDRLIVSPVSKRNGVLAQAREITRGRDNDVGGATENGIWIFFRDAIDKREHWDNIFIYSDQQAGHGGLYGTREGKNEYVQRGFAAKGSHGWSTDYVDVAKLIQEYRDKVNPFVNVFSVQTAGYDNVVIPEYGFRTNILYGWTGKELVFADEMIRFWDQKEADARPVSAQEPEAQ